MVYGHESLGMDFSEADSKAWFLYLEEFGEDLAFTISVHSERPTEPSVATEWVPTAPDLWMRPDVAANVPQPNLF